MEGKIDLKSEFKLVTGEEPKVVASAPGRVNLIGEHTDYNRGMVLPMAVERRVWAAGSPIDGAFELTSSDIPGGVLIRSRNLKRTETWADYPLGVIWALQESGWKIPGLRAHYHGNIPLGGGLSSSAAIEVATAILVAELFNLSISRKEIALTCQLAENKFVGMKCGVMDQMTSALAEKDNALFIDCADLSFERVPLNVDGYRIVIINSGVKGELAYSAYNKRRNECEDAARKLGVRSLREVSVKDLGLVEKLDEPLNKRARHVVTENHRVKKAIGHLRSGELVEFGELMKISHESLRFDYEVSIPELDFLVDSCNAVDGVLGARLTGAGFGGCVVALAHADTAPEIERTVLSKYRERFKREATIMITNAAPGAEIEHS